MASEGEKRERRPPAYLQDYVCETLPTPSAGNVNQDKSVHTETVEEDLGAVGGLSIVSQESNKTSRKSSLTSHRSGRTHVSSNSSSSINSVISSLSQKHTTKLEKLRKHAELKELKRRQSEDRQLDVLVAKVEDEAFEAQKKAEEEIIRARIESQVQERRAFKERERLQTEISRKRQVREAERMLAEVELVDQLLDHSSAIMTPKSEFSLSYESLLDPNATVFTSLLPDNELSNQINSQCEIQTEIVDDYAHVPDNFQSNGGFIQVPQRYPESIQHVTRSPRFDSNPRQSFQSYEEPRPSTQPYITERLIVPSYGIPQPTLPSFATGKERDFAILKMAFDSIVDSHAHLPEQYKYQVLLDRLGGSPKRLAEAFLYDVKPYTSAMQALKEMYGQPRQLVQSELAMIMNLPTVRYNDFEMFENLALSVQTLVGMLRSLEGDNGFELRCGSHVDRLLSKLPQTNRDGFIEYCLNKGILSLHKDNTYNLLHFSEWLKLKARAKKIAHKATTLYQAPKPVRDTTPVVKRNVQQMPTSVFNSNTSKFHQQVSRSSDAASANQRTGYCAYCNKQHHISTCSEFQKLSVKEIVDWMKDKRRCWNCGRTHTAKQCNLKKLCMKCDKTHLTILHDANDKIRESFQSTQVKQLFVDQPTNPASIILKIVPVILHGPTCSVQTYAILDDGSMRTMVTSSTVSQLELLRTPASILLSTIRRGSFDCHGHSVSFDISPLDQPNERFTIRDAFTSDHIALSEYSYDVDSLQRDYPHLQGSTLPAIHNVHPTILIGSDNANLILPVEPVKFGPPGTPLAVCTKFGWTLQGPTQTPVNHAQTTCFLTSSLSYSEKLMHQVENLWKMDTQPYSRKQVIRSKEDKQAMSILDSGTIKMTVDNEIHYATPLLRRNNATPLHESKEAVMSSLKRTEKHHSSKPELTSIHNNEIQKLVDSNYVREVSEDEANKSDESWFIPHHIVQHNGKSRLVFNCSYEYRGENLNKQLIPGPTIGSTLLGVLLRFRRNKVAISGDIKAMFHQVRLLPEDQPLLRFIWRQMNIDTEPTIYQWQVLPFGTTCSPCCATYALQKHAITAHEQFPEVTRCVKEAFYVDNCLDSLTDPEKAKQLVANLRKVLQEGGFNIRQWACNFPEVLADLPIEAKSTSFELWSTLNQDDVNEAALGLCWNCDSDSLSYKYRPVSYDTLNMKAMYQVLATQYDPIGYLTPFTARAKILVQDMWKSKRTWEDEISKGELREQFTHWESELGRISEVHLPRCYVPSDFDTTESHQQLHVFCDSSERVYGSVAYLRTVNQNADTCLSFVAARSRVAPLKQISMPRLELCAALTGAQLADTLSKELNLPISDTYLWSDSTTVLKWLQSDSCRYKVYVGTRVTEIQSLTPVDNWSYINTKVNPADDITRGKFLHELCIDSRWRSGPSFLLSPSDQWPLPPPVLGCDITVESENELRKTIVCQAKVVNLPDISKYSSFESLVKATAHCLDGAAAEVTQVNTVDCLELAEIVLLRKVQEENFPEELVALRTGKSVLTTSRLIELAPEYDADDDIIRVGGRLRLAEEIPENAKHPVVLDPNHHITKLIIKDVDDKLHHYGSERLLAELRRKVWILRGREAVRKHQRKCTECQKLRARPKVPKMADLPTARLRLHKPAFYSTGIDCFGPMWIKIGRRQEKRWGVIFKCMTTRAVYLDLLESMDSDAFLMATRRFISHHGKPYELLSDCGTNFKGGESELYDAFTVMKPDIASQLSSERIRFRYNPPYAPHFGGLWEREIRSVKHGLYAILGEQIVTEPVLRTVLAEIVCILNSKPLGYVTSDIADVDPVTPNSLLLGRRDASLPQVVYPEDELLGRKRWRHSQILADQFWKTFIRRYLPSLQSRGKWQKDQDSVKKGDVVMIMDPQQIRAKWMIGRVTEAFSGSDNRVRSATVRVGKQDYLRPVSRLVRLPDLDNE